MNCSTLKADIRNIPLNSISKGTIHLLLLRSTPYLKRGVLGSVVLLLHFHKVLALSKFALLKCENEVNPVARIPWATSTAQIEIAQYWWPGESVLWGSLQFRTLNVQILKVLTLCESAKVKQRYL